MVDHKKHDFSLFLKSNMKKYKEKVSKLLIIINHSLLAEIRFHGFCCYLDFMNLHKMLGQVSAVINKLSRRGNSGKNMMEI